MGLAERVAALFKRAGASSFSNYVQHSEPRAAFAEAVKDAKHESGHGGYTGTIAEKNGFEIRHRTPMTRAEAGDFIDKDIDSNDKWAPAYAVPIGEETKGTEKKFKVRVPARDEIAAREPAEKAVREQYVFGAGQPATGVSAQITFGKVERIKEGKLPEMTVEKGGEKGFKVTGPGTRSNTEGWDHAKIFPTRAEAVAAIKTVVMGVKPKTGDKYRIVAFKTSDTFTIGDTSKMMHLFQVEGTVTVSKSTGKIIGWIFYGYASD